MPQKVKAGAERRCVQCPIRQLFKKTVCFLVAITYYGAKTMVNLLRVGGHVCCQAAALMTLFVVERTELRLVLVDSVLSPKSLQWSC